MIEMKVKSLRDQSLKTSCGSYWLVEGEIKSVTFKNMAEFEAYLGMGVFQPVASDAPESKNIPVVVPVPVDEEGLPLALHDGENELPLSNDPEEVGEEEETLPEPVIDPEIDPEDEEEDFEEDDPEDEEEDLEDEDEDDPEDYGDWTNQIDHVG